MQEKKRPGDENRLPPKRGSAPPPSQFPLSPTTRPKVPTTMAEPIPFQHAPPPNGTTLETDTRLIASELLRRYRGYAIVGGNDPATTERLCAEIGRTYLEGPGRDAPWPQTAPIIDAKLLLDRLHELREARARPVSPHISPEARRALNLAADGRRHAYREASAAQSGCVACLRGR